MKAKNKETIGMLGIGIGLTVLVSALFYALTWAVVTTFELMRINITQWQAMAIIVTLYLFANILRGKPILYYRSVI